MKRILPAALAVIGLTVPAVATEPSSPVKSQPIAKSIDVRFGNKDVKEVPNFRRHLVPLLGKLGCNGRACHGSFQGQGGFRLSLFGYDFKMDHDGLAVGDEKKNRDPRVLPDSPEDSLAILKPTLEMPHKGGKRMEVGSWEYQVFMKWINGGAKNVDLKKEAKFERLEVTPNELVFAKSGDATQLKIVAVWSDGSREDVTPLCRFKSNDDQVAQISKLGKVTSGKSGDTHIVVFYDNGVKPIPVIRPVSDRVGPNYPKVDAPTKVDQLVVKKLRKLGVVPSEVCSDTDFLRRVCLDISGSLPTAREVVEFVADASSDKRTRKIDELLERPGYAAWWAQKFCDFTGNSDDELNNVVPRGRGIRRTASQDWYDWLNKRIADNVSYDKLVEGIVVAKSRNEDESYLEFCKSLSNLYRPEDSKGSYADREGLAHYWSRRNYRQPDERAIGFAYSFLGIRIQCASCHKHPFDQWTLQDFKQFTGFFANVQGYSSRASQESQADAKKLIAKLGLKDLRGNDLRRKLPELLADGKTVPFNEVFPVKPRPRPTNSKKRKRQRGGYGNVTEAKLLGSDNVDLTEYDDSRQPLMDWLRQKDNPLFARAFVNRVWSAYFNVGIVEPPDDNSLANPPSNAELLEYLSQGFIESGFDMKWVHRTIANSATYQRSWRPNETNKMDERNFSHAIPRRMPAEVVLDAIKQTTLSDEESEKMQRNMSGRAIALAAAGRRYSTRTTGMSFALNVFGRSVRETNCECDRSAEATLLQTVFMQNDEEVFNMIRDRNGWVNQVAKELGVPGVSSSSRSNNQRGSRTPKQLIARAKAQLAKAKKAKNEQLVKRYQRQIASLKKRAKAGASRVAQPTKKPKGVRVAALDSESIVKSAYLRTLSRYPTGDEMARSKQYLETADNTLDGVQGLLWALLNTKEFIVNH